MPMDIPKASAAQRSRKHTAFGRLLFYSIYYIHFRRLWPYIYVNRVDLQLRSVDHLPYPASTFDACFHVDCFYFWPCLITSLKNIWRILRPDGRLVTTFQTKHLSDLSKRGWFQYGNPDPLTYVLALERSGYDRIEWIKCPTVDINSKESYDCIIAYKPIVRLLKCERTNKNAVNRVCKEERNKRST
ncbi:unnamed protein product [Trichobilharzia regenti]|nr:unnamed protein product [Trichobilharzia regenti]